jgi:hypothetical protein
MAETLVCTQHKVLAARYTKMATATPPVRPRVQFQTDQTSRKYYTIHSNRNNAFTLKLNEDSRTAIVGFAKMEDAFRVGNMIETYYIEKKEWPDLYGSVELILPEGRLSGLAHIFIEQWEFDELKITCTSNFLDFISVEKLTPESNKYGLSGDMYIFQAPDDFYRATLAELYTY